MESGGGGEGAASVPPGSFMLRGDLLGQHPIGLGPAGVGVVVQYGHSVAGGFGQADVAGDHRGIDLAGEVALDLLRHPFICFLISQY